MLSEFDLQKRLQEIKPLLTDKFHVSKIGYFGSYSQGRQTNDSDVDLIVEFSQPICWGFFTLEQFLEQSLGLRVDLVTKNALKERIKDSTLNQIRYI